MIGSIDPKFRQATVVGAGFSGLLLAYELDRAGFEITLIEAEKLSGGMIRTELTDLGLIESAAHSFLATPEVRELCADLGVELVDVRRDSKARFILRNGKMRKFPLSMVEVFKALIRAYFVLSKPELSGGRATMEQWANRHLGAAALQYLISPFLTGIYAARPSEVIVAAAFPTMMIPSGHSLLSYQLHRLRKRGRSGGRPKMMAPLKGMGALTRALEQRLEARLGSRFRKGEVVEKLPDTPNLILTVPADRAARLLRSEDPKLAAMLERVRYSPLVSVTILAPKSTFPKEPKGVGVLIPASENRDCLGVLFNSSAFPGRVTDESEWLSLTMMLGGSARPEFATYSEQQLREIVLKELEALFAIRDFSRVQTRIHRWTCAIPQYGDELMDCWDLARRGWCSKPGRVLFGNYSGDVSLRGMTQAANAMGRSLATQLQG